MNKELKRSYNKLNDKYIFERSNINIYNWSSMPFDKKTAMFIIESGYISGNFKFRLKPYKNYWLWSLRWSILRAYKPIERLNKQSKKHITIVMLMIITILVMIWLAYKFNQV